MKLTAWPSFFSIPFWVFSQAENLIAEGNAASEICLMRSFTGEVSARSMCRPGPKVTIST